MSRHRVMTVCEGKAVDLESGVYEAWISREVIDRGKDLVVAAGVNFENFMKNPVVQWAHRYDEPPIARALTVEVEPGVGVRSKFQFPPFGTSERADEIHRLWRAGFINATSIGFQPEDDELMSADDEDGFFYRAPRKYLRWELLEFSLVPIPANQDALRRSMRYLMTPAQRRREKRRVNEQARNGRTIAPVEHIVHPDSELLSSLSDMQKHLNNLKGVLNYGRVNQRAT